MNLARKLISSCGLLVRAGSSSVVDRTNLHFIAIDDLRLGLGCYPQLLRDMVAETEKWSRNHVRPLWFDSEAAEQMWDRNGMPNYEATFEVK
ncbi:MAG: hypothetical protein PSU94_00105 [Lacunisphaera sp.]|nr:hypothetical protein [Lacunisphaera sp.]